MTTRMILLLAATAMLGAACGNTSSTSSTSASDRPADAATTDEDHAPATVAADAAASADPGAEIEQFDLDRDDFDDRVQAAGSEFGSEPRYGGGKPQGTLGELFDFTAPAVFGEEIVGTEYLGRDLVLWFWAPWCSWCNVEAPRVSAAAQKFGDEVTILGIAGVSGLDAMQAFVRRHELELIDHVADVDGAMWADFDVNYQPWWIFINDDGTVIENWQGRLSDDEISENIEFLVAS
jgi:peroxiredoxin